jgi:CNT family concentrative nucleoside transporter
MLIAAIATISLLDYALGKMGLLLVSTFFDSAKDVIVFNIDLNNLTLGGILGGLFHYAALMMGVPLQDATTVGGLMGTKMVINEFVAYSRMAPMIDGELLDPKSIIIATFALCGFANFSSVAMLIGGLGELAPDRKHDLAKLGIRAMFCGTLASYLSASIAGILYTDPAAAANQSMALPITIIVIASLIIFGFNIAAKKSGKVPASI